jgi:hypothetical protein
MSDLLAELERERFARLPPPVQPAPGPTARWLELHPDPIADVAERWLQLAMVEEAT